MSSWLLKQVEHLPLGFKGLNSDFRHASSLTRKFIKVSAAVCLGLSRAMLFNVVKLIPAHNWSRTPDAPNFGSYNTDHFYLFVYFSA
jgi:hypothetical protein